MDDASSNKARWLAYLAVGGVALGAAYWAYIYTRRLAEEDDEREAAENKQAEDHRNLVASSSSRSMPASSSSGADEVEPPRHCSLCGTTGRGLLRCSRCKSAWYCNATCQRKAWPTHKADCKAAAGPAAAAAPAAPSSSTPQQPAADQAGPPTPPTPSQGESSSAAAAEAAAAPQDFSQALSQYLQQAESSKSDSIEQTFETAVLMFLRAEFRPAIAKFQEARAMALQARRADVAGDVLRFLGHAYNKLADVGAAEHHFLQGVQEAKAAGNLKLQVDCLSGLGCMYRAQEQADRSVQYLTEALQLAQQCDREVQAAVLCNLGAAMMSVDPPAAMRHLQRAVELREAEVVAAAESGNNAALGNAVMEHASALVNLASALYCAHEYDEAEVAYMKALEVFELIQDVDKVAKVLVNLANMAELQQAGPGSRAKAARHRRALFTFLEQHAQRRAPEECSVCLQQLDVTQQSPDDSPVIIMACYHCFHNKCWEQWSSQQATCPNCKQPVPLF